MEAQTEFEHAIEKMPPGWLCTQPGGIFVLGGHLMATYAVCLAERFRLAGRPFLCQARIVKNPYVGDDGAAIPTAGDDYLLSVKDPRPSAAISGGANDNQASHRAQAAIIADDRWHNAASTDEHELRMRGMTRGAEQGTPTHPGWLLYDVGDTRENTGGAGIIPDSQVVFA